MNQRIHYCKGLLHTGKPIIIKDMDTEKEINTDDIELHNVNIRMKLDNAVGKEKQRGARCVLEVWR